MTREVRTATHLEQGTDVPFPVMPRVVEIEPERRTDPGQRNQGRDGLESPPEETAFAGRSSTSSYGGTCRESSVPEVHPRVQSRYATCSRRRRCRGS